jgi:hypothetical protein
MLFGFILEDLAADIQALAANLRPNFSLKRRNIKTKENIVACGRNEQRKETVSALSEPSLSLPRSTVQSSQMYV